MKLVLGVALVLVGLASHVEGDCNRLQRFKVRNQWNAAFGEGRQRIRFGTVFWRNLFKDHPDYRDLFKRVGGDNIYSPEFQAHAHRVLGGLEMTINLLDDEGTLAAQLAHLKGQHVERNVKAEHFDTFRNHLLEVLPKYLGHKLDYQAWHDCFDFISAGIKP